MRKATEKEKEALEEGCVSVEDGDSFCATLQWIDVRSMIDCLGLGLQQTVLEVCFDIGEAY
jgi:hypothetical protein